MDKVTLFRLVIMTIGTALMLAAIVVLGIILFNNRNKLDSALVPNKQTGSIKETETKAIDDSGVLPNSPVEYWVKEARGRQDKEKGQITWLIHITKENAQMRKNGQIVGAKGAVVRVEVRADQTLSLTGIVGEDGWVSWTTTLPKVPTGLYILDVQGELPWSVDNQALWKDREVVSYTPPAVIQ